MTTFLVRDEPPPGDGPLVAVKDLIDVRGLPTTSACRPLAERATPAEVDAAVVATIRANGGRLVGKVNLHELAFGGTGINAYTGTPINPLDPTRIPGGSSSGSAVAVATGEADIALGTDTGGSVRTPAACCGVVGLKTTFGRISVEGVRPLAPSMDTVGPLARTVDDIVRAMALLEPGFAPADEVPDAVGRFRLPGTDPAIEAAIDAALARAELPTVAARLPGWEEATEAGTTVVFAEAARVHAELVAEHGARLGADTLERLRHGATIDAAGEAAARATGRRFADQLDEVLDRWSMVALPAILTEPPTLDDADSLSTRHPHVAVNLAGNPAIVVPVASGRRLPTAIQLIGPRGGEELLVATAARIESSQR